MNQKSEAAEAYLFLDFNDARNKKTETIDFPRLLKKRQMQGSRSVFLLPVRQAILKREAYFIVRCDNEG